MLTEQDVLYFSFYLNLNPCSDYFPPVVGSVYDLNESFCTQAFYSYVFHPFCAREEGGVLTKL